MELCYRSGEGEAENAEEASGESGIGNRESESDSPLPTPDSVPSVMGFRGVQEANGAITLRWDRPPASSGVDGYRLYTSLDGTDIIGGDRNGGDRNGRFEFEPLTDIEGWRTSYRFAPTCGSLYFITAIGDGGESSPSESVFFAAPCTGGNE